jgi:cyanophycinase
MNTSSAERKLEQFRSEPLRPGDPRHKPKGRLLIIGGHEDKKHEKLILRELVRLTGSGKLVVATLASEEGDQAWAEYEPVLRGIGARHVYHLDVAERSDGDSIRAMRILEDATTVFFTGGDQLRITSLIGDTPTFSRVFEIFLNGGLIAGTSAGASVMSETMMVGGTADGSHRIEDNLRLAPGFGFARDMVIDQHFAERGRINRLLAVIAQNPRVLGVGIDENTAIELESGRSFRVIGDGGVTVIDGRTVTETTVSEEEPDRTMSLFGATVHLLSQGDRFDMRTREPEQRSAEEVDEEIGVEHASASQAADDK